VQLPYVDRVTWQAGRLLLLQLLLLIAVTWHVKG